MRYFWKNHKNYLDQKLDFGSTNAHCIKISAFQRALIRVWYVTRRNPYYLTKNREPSTLSYRTMTGNENWITSSIHGFLIFKTLNRSLSLSQHFGSRLGLILGILQTRSIEDITRYLNNKNIPNTEKFIKIFTYHLCCWLGCTETEWESIRSRPKPRPLQVQAVLSCVSPDGCMDVFPLVNQENYEREASYL